MGNNGTSVVLPPPSAARYRRWFSRYTRYYLRRHFHAARVVDRHLVPAADRPLVVYLNHAAWWDPLFCLLLAERCFGRRSHWAIIEQRQLDRYRVFARLGFIGIEPGRRGARRLLELAAPLAERPRGALWLTPQGRFADPRERPLRLAPGLGHLARRLPNAYFVPLALEYPFWYERLPEALAKFGAPFCPAEHPRQTAADYTALFSERLSAAADALASLSQARDGARFELLLTGRAGVGGVYDLWRRAGARWRGERFNAAHGDGR